MAVNNNKIEARKKKVLEAKLKNPNATEREIAKEVGAGNGTVHRDLDKLEQDGAKADIPVINAIKDADLEIVTMAQSHTLSWMKDIKVQDLKREDINVIHKVGETSQKRYSFLGGDNAKDDGTEQKKIFFLPEND